MTKLLRAAVAALIAGLMLVVMGSVAPANADQSDTGALDISKAQAAHANCGKAASDLISTSKRYYYMRSSAFMRIQRARLLAANISTTSTLSNGTQVTSTDVIHCVGRALRKGSRAQMTVYYAITLAPDLIDWLMSGKADSTPPPPPTYSVTYTTGSTPSW